MAFWRRNPVTGQQESVDGDHNSLADVEFKPEKFKEELTTSFKSELESLKAAQAEANKPLLEFVSAMQAERAERAEAVRKQTQREQNENNQVTAEDYMLDPDAATRKALKPVATATMMLAAKMAKQETLAEKEYYHGSIKSKVDAMIAQQSLEAQTRTDVIENCYKLVMFDHMQDIQDGKIKSRNSSVVFEGGSTGAHSGNKSDGSSETLTQEEQQVAKLMGLTEKEWISSKKELSYV